MRVSQAREFEVKATQNLLDVVRVDDTLAACPGVQNLPGVQWEGRPCNGALGMACAHIPVSQIPESLPSESKKLWQDWQKEHEGFTTEVPIHANQSRNKTSRCYLQGVCLCKGRGLKLAKMHKVLQQVLKASYEKQDLVRGFAVVEICQLSHVTDKWLHVSHACLSPLITTVLPLEEQTGMRVHEGSRLLKPHRSLPFCTLVEALAGLDLREEVEVVCWRLADSERYVPRQVIPGVVEVACVPDSRSMIWKGRAEVVRRQRAIAAHDEPDVEVELAADMASSSADDDDDADATHAEFWEGLGDLEEALAHHPPAQNNEGGSDSDSSSSSSSSNSSSSTHSPAPAPDAELVVPAGGGTRSGFALSDSTLFWKGFRFTQ
eukprot:6492113-Amphidinium_carterae.2